MNRIFKLSFFIVCLVSFLTSCQKNEEPNYEESRHTMIITCLGYNNLSSYMRTNISDFCKGQMPSKNSNKAVVVFSHQTRTNINAYEEKTLPVLYRIYSEGSEIIFDTLVVYPNTTISASSETIHKVLTDVKQFVPSKSYGMLFSSHATAWIPKGYDVKVYNDDSIFLLRPQSYDWGRKIEDENHNNGYPLTKTMGAYYYKKADGIIYSEEIDIEDFVKAIPMHLDYFISDACLMSSIEVLWDFKDVCDYFIASPAEILAQGFNYSTLAKNILNNNHPDLYQVAKDYFDQYDKQSGSSRSATIAYIDCKKINKLASVFSSIVSGNSDDIIDNFDIKSVQKYFYSDQQLCFFYDIQDFVHKYCDDEVKIAEFDDALRELVIYHAETPQFFEDSLDLVNCCGISIYLPHPIRMDLTEFYPNLSWSKSTNYLQ